MTFENYYFCAKPVTSPSRITELIFEVRSTFRNDLVHEN